MGNNPSRNASATTTPRASSSRRLFQGLGVAANQPDPNSSETSAGDRDYSQYASESAAGSGSAAVKLQTPPPLEYVDGGQTHSFGKLYRGIPDYDMVIVKKFILEKRLAPFFSPLDEVAAKAKDANSADDKDEESASKTTEEALKIKLEEQDNEKSAGSAGINSDHSDHPSSMECPICFMLYPPYFNYTKCCDQPICTDCFIQIKRPESTFEPAPCPYCQTPNLSIIYQSKDRLAGNTSTFPVIIESVDESDASANVKESPTTSDSKNPSIPSVVSANIDKDQTVQPAQNIQSSSGADGDSAAGFVSTAPTASLSRRQSNHPVLTSDDIRPDWRERKQKIELDRILEQQRIALATARRRQMEAFSQAEIANAALFAAQIYEGSSGSSGGRSNSLLRSFRNGSGRRNEETQAQYVRAMRYLGADVEELMLLEAMRRSMQDSNPQTTTVTAVEASPLPATTTENAPIESQPDNSEPEPS